MKGCEEIKPILAFYRDASREERAAADAHMAGCASCARSFAAYGEADALISAAPGPSLPARLARPFAALLHERAEPQSRSALGFAFGRSLAPAAVVLVLLVALSALIWSVSESGGPVTSTPTLTSTLTPTTMARGTGAAMIAVFTAAQPPPAPAAVPTPAPAPDPKRNLGPLFAGSAAHATMTH